MRRLKCGILYMTIGAFGSLGVPSYGAQAVSMSVFSDPEVLVSSPQTTARNSGVNTISSLVDIKAQDAQTLQTKDGKIGMASQEHFGQGIIIDSTGIIATNRHIIGNAEHIYVVLSNGKGFEGKVVRDSKVDLCFVKINTPYPLTAISLGDSSQAQIGNKVFAFANAGLNDTREKNGQIINLFTESQTDNVEYIEMSMSLHPGDSGGPILNEQGSLLGLIMGNQKSDPTKSYAIASNTIHDEYLKIKNSFLN